MSAENATSSARRRLPPARGRDSSVTAICAAARERGIVTVVDGSQAVPHRPVDVQAIG